MKIPADRIDNGQRLGRARHLKRNPSKQQDSRSQNGMESGGLKGCIGLRVRLPLNHGESNGNETGIINRNYKGCNLV